jgi:hypothetical protein
MPRDRDAPHGYVYEILFGGEVQERLPVFVKSWVKKTRAGQAEAIEVLADDPSLL